MAIKPICDSCGQELVQFGGLLFSPPTPSGEVKKLHLCQDCYAAIIQRFNPKAAG